MRTLVAILAGLPLLMPPGVCACRLAGCFENQLPAHPEAACVAEPAHAHAGCCDCERAAACDSAADHFRPDNQPSRPEKEHAPWCSGRIAVDLSRPADNGSATSLLFFPPPADVALAVPDVLRANQPSADAPPRRHGPPIYLAVRALLI